MEHFVCVCVCVHAYTNIYVRGVHVHVHVHVYVRGWWVAYVCEGCACVCEGVVGGICM